MAELVASIEDHGVDTPLLLRPADEGRYTIISGHRRKHAADLIGLDSLPAIIRDMTDDDAIDRHGRCELATSRHPPQ